MLCCFEAAFHLPQKQSTLELPSVSHTSKAQGQPSLEALIVISTLEEPSVRLAPGSRLENSLSWAEVRHSNSLSRA